MTHLVWFRNNLRTTDNTPLWEACQAEGNVIGVYCFDPRHYGETAYGFPKTGAFRAQFLIESVTTLQQQLEKLNIPLWVFQQQPEQVFPHIIEEGDVTAVHSQTEWTQEENEVTNALKKALPPSVQWKEYYDQFLFHPDDIPYNDFDTIPRVFTEFRKKCEKYAKVRPTLDIPKAQSADVLAVAEQHQQRFKIPTLHELKTGVPIQDTRTAFPFQGGEKAGWARLEDYVWKTQNISTYKQTRNELIGVEYSSKFSAWLANGSLSPRIIYWEVKKFEKEITKNQDTYWMIFELIWRDFFKYVSLKHGKELFTLGGILKKEYDWGNSKNKLQQWIQGNTKHPFVNANMKEIAQTGWMSNRGRQNVASFWAKELQQDWRMGASYFESQLIDYDVHSNWGNWQYVSGVGNDPRDRKFNIEKQADRYDPDGEYVSLWLDKEE